MVLERTSEMLMSIYMDQIQSQLHVWITNIWKREEECIFGPNGEIHSTRPNDVINILKSQISIGQEWLTRNLLARVVSICLETLIDEVKARYHSIVARSAEIDIESICSFINDTNVLQVRNS